MTGSCAAISIAIGTPPRHFSFFTPINRIDTFTIAITQSSSPDELDPRYEAVLSTIKFLL